MTGQNIQEYVLPRPKQMDASTYSLHQLVASLCDGNPCIWRAEPESLILRSGHVAFSGVTPAPTKTFELGATLIFQLRASVSKKTRGKHFYLPVGDHKARLEWLHSRSEAHGFKIITTASSSRKMLIEDQHKRRIQMDCTDFQGVLQITDVDTFKLAYDRGLPGPGRAFGFGLLLV